MDARSHQIISIISSDQILLDAPDLDESNSQNATEYLAASHKQAFLRFIHAEWGFLNGECDARIGERERMTVGFFSTGTVSRLRRPDDQRPESIWVRPVQGRMAADPKCLGGICQRGIPNVDEIQVSSMRASTDFGPGIIRFRPQ